ncbi:DUF4240 domain-containing protein [Myxococcota bacterium]|nr:DUF4240 domain-containing protein [Myxococcota bacterium]
MTERERAAVWVVLEALPPAEIAWSARAWRALLDPLVARVGEASFASSFAAAFNAAVDLEVIEAFFLFTDHVDAELFAEFVVALMLRGEETFEQCLADPQNLARLGLPHDLHHEGEEIFTALVDSSVKLDLDFDGCIALSTELLARIRAVDLKGRTGFRARIPEFESEDAYRSRHRDAIYRSMLAGRWPELARTSNTPPLNV